MSGRVILGGKEPRLGLTSQEVHTGRNEKERLERPERRLRQGDKVFSISRR